MKFKLTLLFCALVSPNVLGQAPKLILKQGEVAALVFPDGRVAVFHSKSESRRLKTELSLSQNTCSSVERAQCKAEFPFTANLLTLIWKSHPKNAGKFVTEKIGDKFQPVSNWATAFPLMGGESKLNEFTSGYGEMICNDYEFIPWTQGNSNFESNIIFWDEDFETTIDELKYARNAPEHRAGTITARLESIPLFYNGNRVLFGPSITKPKEFFNLLTFGYSLQWTFAKQSISNPKDKLCQVKLDLNFNRIFEQINEFFENTKSVKEGEKYTPVIVGSEAFRVFEWLMEEALWHRTFQ